MDGPPKKNEPQKKFPYFGVLLIIAGFFLIPVFGIGFALIGWGVWEIRVGRKKT